MCHEAFSCLSRGDLLHDVSDEFVHRPLHLLVKDLAAHLTAILRAGPEGLKASRPERSPLKRSREL